MRAPSHVTEKFIGLALLTNTYVTILIQGGPLLAQARRDRPIFLVLVLKLINMTPTDIKAK